MSQNVEYTSRARTKKDAYIACIAYIARIHRMQKPTTRTHSHGHTHTFIKRESTHPHNSVRRHYTEQCTHLYIRVVAIDDFRNSRLFLLLAEGSTSYVDRNVLLIFLPLCSVGSSQIPFPRLIHGHNFRWLFFFFCRLSKFSSFFFSSRLYVEEDNVDQDVQDETSRFRFHDSQVIFRIGKDIGNGIVSLTQGFIGVLVFGYRFLSRFMDF